MKYYSIPKLSRDEILTKLNSIKKDEVIEGILSACKEGDDYELALSILKQFSENDDRDICRIAISSVSLVILNFQKINLLLALDLIRDKLFTQDKELKSTCESVLDDMVTFFPDQASWISKSSQKKLDNLDNIIISFNSSKDNTKINFELLEFVKNIFEANNLQSSMKLLLQFSDKEKIDLSKLSIKMIPYLFVTYKELDFFQVKEICHKALFKHGDLIIKEIDELRETLTALVPKGKKWLEENLSITELIKN